MAQKAGQNPFFSWATLGHLGHPIVAAFCIDHPRPICNHTQARPPRIDPQGNNNAHLIGPRVNPKVMKGEPMTLPATPRQSIAVMLRRERTAEEIAERLGMQIRDVVTELQWMHRRGLVTKEVVKEVGLWRAVQ